MSQASRLKERFFHLVMNGGERELSQPCLSRTLLHDHIASSSSFRAHQHRGNKHFDSILIHICVEQSYVSHKIRHQFSCFKDSFDGMAVFFQDDCNSGRSIRRCRCRYGQVISSDCVIVHYCFVHL